jgi:subtilisin family serine protease
MPLKVFSGNHTNSFLLAKAIQYSAYNGAKVINCSFGGYQYSSILKKAVDYARSLGAIVVAGVGNDNSSNYFYPAGYDGVLSVGATASDDQKADFSNYGDWVNVFAPGDKICSTLPNNAYGNLSGTSMACPFVSGLAGLLIAKEPELTNDEIIERIKNYSDNIDSVNALYAGKLGSGRINAYKVLAKTNYNLNITTVASDIKQVKVYPNPFDPQKDNQGMRIENIAPKTEIKIYNVLGQLVKKLEDADENGYEFWNGKNDANNIVASGVYIMFLKNGTEIKKIKIAVEK